MEGSEDDAGTATNASRRAAAREKDVGVPEDVKATSSFQQEPSEIRSSCQTPAMSEDNFDGDSVPSPSAQDVNASTEAILDMIDEFVDGPGAPRRLPRAETDDPCHEELASDGDHSELQESKESGQNVASISQVLTSTASTPDKEPQPAVSSNILIETLTAEVPKSNVNNDSVDMTQASSSVVENCETDKVPTKSGHGEQVSIQPDPSPPINIPSSSGCQTMQRILDNECEIQERTVKCVTSSDNRDNVTVESAESTSSDSVSDEKASLVESQTHSPLRRRLVRPALCDRRPDSTVSSTVDSQSVTVMSSDQSGRDSIAKDVSSSSDAVPTTHGNVKPEEIRNVSEISICKAETSVSPPKKIKLVRQKVTAGNNTRDLLNKQKSVSSDNDQCQSTSSDIHTAVSSVPSSACLDTVRVRQSIEESAIATEFCREKVQTCTQEIVMKTSQSNVSSFVQQPVESDNNFNSSQNKLGHLSDPQARPPREPESESSSSRTVQTNDENDKNSLLHEHVQQHDIEQGDNFNESNSDQRKVLPIKLNLGTTSLPPSTNYDEEIKIHQDVDTDQSEILSQTEQSSIKQSNVAHEELENKVPKLTIKLKHDESMSPPTVPKLTIKPLKPPRDGKSSSNSKQEDDISNSNIKSLKPSTDNERTSSTGQSGETKSGVSKLTIKPQSRARPPTAQDEQMDNQSEEMKSPVPKLTIKPIKPPVEYNADTCQDVDKSKGTVPKLTIKPIKPPTDQVASADTVKQSEETKSSVPKVTIKPLRPPTEHDDISSNIVQQTEQNISPVPKVTIKPIKPPSEYNASTADKDKPSVESKSPIPKLTIKAIQPLNAQDDSGSTDTIQHVSCLTKLNIKPIPNIKQSQIAEGNEAIRSVTKLNIKPILKPPEKINDVHRKSSSSEISESEYSENDESASTSDQASASDQGTLDTVPKVTIKLGKPGTESEGKFYTEQNVSKTTRKGIQIEIKDDEEPKLTVVISQQEDKNSEKVPKLTIKTVAKSENAPLSPKVNIKPMKADLSNKETDIPKIKISGDTLSPSTETRENAHVPKITIKPVTRSEAESSRTPKKLVTSCDSSEHIPVVTKLNIKPIIKPADSEITPQSSDDRVPVVSKLNIKPIIKPQENDIDSNADSIPKVTKLNIKPLKYPEDTFTEEKDYDDVKANVDSCSIPVVTKLNIKAIVKPTENDLCSKEADNQSSETGNSSDDNGDHIPVVTKLNIKPIVRPDDKEGSYKMGTTSEDAIPVVTKLNIKPLVKPTENASPLSPKKELKSPDVVNSSIPIVTKLHIKPIVNPDEIIPTKSKEELGDKSLKKPSLVMKINMKTVNEISNHEAHTEHNNCNNIGEHFSYSGTKLLKNSKADLKTSEAPDNRLLVNIPTEVEKVIKSSLSPADKQNCKLDLSQEKESSERSVIKKAAMLSSPKRKPKSPDTVLENKSAQESIDESKSSKNDSLPMIVPSHDMSSKLNITGNTNKISDAAEVDVKNTTEYTNVKPVKSTLQSVQNCTLLKKLLESSSECSNKSLDNSKQVNCVPMSNPTENDNSPGNKNIVNCQQSKELRNTPIEKTEDLKESPKSPVPDIPNDKNYSIEISQGTKSHQDVNEILREKLKEPLEISISDKSSTQSSGQDSPRIILKINKTEQGASSKIITEDMKRPDTQQNYAESSPQDIFNDRLSPKKQMLNSRRKQAADPEISLATGKRLRSSRIVEVSDKSSPLVKRNMGKRPSDLSPPHNKETELSVLQTKRLKLGQLLQGNKSLTITPVPIVQTQTSPTIPSIEIKPGVKAVNHSLLNNENCAKNGNSKLHNILSTLHAKQMQSVSLNNTNCSEKAQTMSSDIEVNSSMGSSDTTEIIPVDNSLPGLQEMLINENSDFRDLSVGTEESSQDPLEVHSLKTTDGANDDLNIPKVVEMTPQPKKRGRPRKIPLSEPSRPAAVSLPVPALEERPQRSLRLMRDRPAILRKPRGGRGRGRGGRRSESTSAETSPIIVIETIEDPPEDKSTPGEIDPTSSRIKLPRMTEALDKMPSVCVTPLSSRRDSETMYTPDTPNLKVMLETSLKAEDPGELTLPSRGRGSRGGRGGRGRTPRGRGRGRGGGRGAMYMKETMGIYGRVCGPATTTVQLFEEETCMMDDNATPAKPSHLLDEDSQSSVKSSTNESSKMKKSKFADLFDSNKVWTAADVKEYMWPPPEKPDGEHKVMMIQEQVAMFLGVKSFKRRYPELKRRTIAAEERDYVLSKRIVTEALCDLGITAVDASDVLDIMLSDYPHKYEEYRSHQRQRQLNEVVPESQDDSKTEERVTRVEMKAEKVVEHKPEVPKVDPEKTRQDMAAAAVASAAEWNARSNAARKGWCVDLQSHTVQRPRARQPAPPAPHVRPPAGFYPHALLPGQYQHSYRVYTPEQLRYFPLNTVLAAPPAPPSPVDSSSDSEAEWGERVSSSDDSDVPTHHSAKRKKLTKVKRSSQADASCSKEEPPEGEVDLCKVCKLRLEANRRYTHERFLVCANCNAKLHPSCVELNADTIRKCREYPWQCAECKTCCACRQPADDDKMLFCDLCDRGFHIYCVGLTTVPSGRWHCVECAICKSCGAREPGGLPPAPATAGGPGTPGPPSTPVTPGPPAEWHHQTKRGPGGHKVYSHSLCTPCARAYRIGRYCPLCERSFIGPKGTMQLVICKLCDRQLHQDCVKQTVTALNVLDYTCADCRRGGITSRAAAVRLAPRTIATLFMAKRRFNKYAHRQYLASRLRDAQNSSEAERDRPDDASDVSDTATSDPLDGAGDDTVELNE